MNRNVLVIAGLDDVDHYGKFVDKCERQGIHTEVYGFGYQEQGTSLGELKNRLLEKVGSFSGIQRLDVVGVSAGGSAAAWVLQQRPDAIHMAINTCGALKLPRESHLNRIFSHKYEALFDEMVGGLKPNSITDERLVSVRSLYDGIVRRSAVKFGESKITEIPAIFHPAAIAYALKFTVPRSLHF